MSILNQNLLTLDFWKDEVTYAGHTLLTGSIGCAAMNISDEQIGQLMQLAIPLAAVVELIKDGTPKRIKQQDWRYIHVAEFEHRKNQDI